MPRKRKKPTAHEPRRSALSAVLTLLRIQRGMLQTEVARAAHVKQSTVSEYEGEGTEPRAEVVGRVAVALGVSLPVVEALAGLFAAVASLLDRLGGPQGPRSDSIAEEMVTGAIRCAGRLVRAIDGLFAPPPLEACAGWPAAEVSEAEDRLAAPGLWQRLKPLAPAARRAVVAEGPEFHSPALVALLCGESIQAAADDADEAVGLADLACFMAEQVTPERRARAQGYAWAHLGNARRVQGDLRAGEAAFRRTADRWQAGVDDGSGLFDEARVLDLEASLRREQRDLPAALDLLDRALAADRTGARAGHILVIRAKTLEEMGDYEEAIATLRRALPLVDGEREPRLRWGLCFNLAENLFQVGRFSEAEPLLPGVQELAEQLGNELDRVRHVWLRARIAAGLGQVAAAEAGFQQVRREFLARRIAYDAALVSLELAALCLDQGRAAEVQAIAAELLPVFEAQQVTRESLATVKLFCDAARQETLTAAMTRRCLKDLRQAGPATRG